MKTIQGEGVVLYDFSPVIDFEGEILEGLAGERKSIPSKFFYDQRGSELFEKICELEEYYPTRTELAIMGERLPEMAASLGPGCRIVELGSGSSTKTRLLLDVLEAPAAYVPVDISGDHLRETAQRLARDYPGLLVQPVVADYTLEFELPPTVNDPQRTVIFFPGSTIGNFNSSEAMHLLRRMTHLCGPDGGLLIGVDLVKDRETLERAYNDRSGVTAEFNLNVLRRINRELQGNFDLDRFQHRAIYNFEDGRIEMYLVSGGVQSVEVAGRRFAFADGEAICTEHSYKYSLRQFDELAEEAGFEMERTWVDEEEKFTVKYLALA